MSEIGNFNFIQMIRAKPETPTVVVNVFSRAGADGLVYRNEAKKPKESVLNTKEACTSIAIANRRYEDYAAIKGTKVTIVNDMDKEWRKVLVVDVDIEQVREIIGGSDTTIHAMVYATWRVIIPEAT